MIIADLIRCNPKGPSVKCRNLVSGNLEEFVYEDMPGDTVHGKHLMPVAVDNNLVDPHAPKITFTEEGKIVLDISSLVIPRSKAIKVSSKQRLRKVVANYKLPYIPRPKKWKEKETLQFFKALSMVGCDFTMMSKIFEEWKLSRSKHELKLKLRSEEKRNRDVVLKIMYEYNHYDSSLKDRGQDLDVEV